MSSTVRSNKLSPAVFVGLHIIIFLNVVFNISHVYNDIQSNIYLPGWTSLWQLEAPPLCHVLAHVCQWEPLVKQVGGATPGGVFGVNTLSVSSRKVPSRWNMAVDTQWDGSTLKALCSKGLTSKWRMSWGDTTRSVTWGKEPSQVVCFFLCSKSWWVSVCLKSGHFSVCPVYMSRLKGGVSVSARVLTSQRSPCQVSPSWTQQLVHASLFLLWFPGTAMSLFQFSPFHLRLLLLG